MKYNSNIFKSEFVKNVLALMTGTTIAVTPILTRIYTPDDFGVFALFLIITTIAGTVIIQNVPDGEVMVGNPARNIKQ